MSKHTAERKALLYVLPGRWDALRAANRFARRTGTRYEVRWYQPRRVWVVREAHVAPPTEVTP